MEKNNILCLEVLDLESSEKVKRICVVRIFRKMKAGFLTNFARLSV
ncbi:MAG: hypothetical protein H7Y04_15700 [Verrucomicrobia bacterium]|nr:hypothetical protein [Cytophagales bacterium]